LKRTNRNGGSFKSEKIAVNKIQHDQIKTPAEDKCCEKKKILQNAVKIPLRPYEEKFRDGLVDEHRDDESKKVCDQFQHQYWPAQHGRLVERGKTSHTFHE
jgi:hypothetical protein